MGAPAWGTRVAAGVTAALVIGVGAALALPVVTGSGSPSVSVDEVPDTSHAALVQAYEKKVAERKADIEASKERQATMKTADADARAEDEADTKAAAEEARTAEERADAAAKEQAEQEAKKKAEADAKAKEDASTKDATESKESTATRDKDTTDKPDNPDWWPESVWAHATTCTVAEDGQSVIGTWDVWVKYGGDWVFVSASDDPAEVSGTDGDKVKIAHADRTAALYKEHDGMAKYRGGPVHVTLASAADSSETHTFTVDLWVVAKADGTCPA